MVALPESVVRDAPLASSVARRCAAGSADATGAASNRHPSAQVWLQGRRAPSRHGPNARRDS